MCLSCQPLPALHYSGFHELRQGLPKQKGVCIVQGRSVMTYVPLPGDGTPRPVTLIPGDGIGPEVTNSVTKVVEALGAPIVWDRCVQRNQAYAGLRTHLDNTQLHANLREDDTSTCASLANICSFTAH